ERLLTGTGPAFFTGVPKVQVDGTGGSEDTSAGCLDRVAPGDDPLEAHLPPPPKQAGHGCHATGFLARALADAGLPSPGLDGCRRPRGPRAGKDPPGRPGLS